MNRYIIKHAITGLYWNKLIRKWIKGEFDATLYTSVKSLHFEDKNAIVLSVNFIIKDLPKEIIIPKFIKPDVSVLKLNNDELHNLMVNGSENDLMKWYELRRALTTYIKDGMSGKLVCGNPDEWIKLLLEIKNKYCHKKLCNKYE